VDIKKPSILIGTDGFILCIWFWVTKSEKAFYKNPRVTICEVRINGKCANKE
jgi:hypothetical protein